MVFRFIYGFGFVFRWALAILLGLAAGAGLAAAGLSGALVPVLGIVTIGLIVGVIEAFGKPLEHRR